MLLCRAHASPALLPVRRGHPWSAEPTATLCRPHPQWKGAGSDGAVRTLLHSISLATDGQWPPRSRKPSQASTLSSGVYFILWASAVAGCSVSLPR